MQKLSFYFIIIIGLVYANLKVKAQDIVDSVNIKPDVLNFATQQKIAWQLDSTIYTQRLDSLNSPLNLVYNTQVQKYIKVYTGNRKNEISVMLEKSKYYFPIFEKALKAYNVPEVFKFLPVIESEMDALAISKSGATGLWQFMYGTAKNYRLTINDYVDERKDPIQASYAAAKYLREAYNELGDWFLALAAYNSGSGAVKRAIIKAGGEKNIWQLETYLSSQTQKYIPAFIAATYVMSYPSCHQIVASNLGVTTMVDSVYVSCHLNLNKLSVSLNLPLHQLKHLNPSYIKGIVNGSLQNPKRLVLPQINKLMYANLYNQLYPTTTDSEQRPNTAVDSSKQGYNLLAKNEIKIKDDQSLQSSRGVDLQSSIYNNSNINTRKPNAINQQNKVINENVGSLQFLIYTNYTVKIGDTLLAIAQQFKGLTVDKIKEINQLDGSLLSVGCILKLFEMNY
ncbi:MAG: LysM peptidoglycan-binding domain-containing protein [Sphingobacteriales bacterium]|nr:MAG: LysM peptidoglycan-binding domain-containing protein [Sphingobacteriales bacterium]